MKLPTSIAAITCLLFCSASFALPKELEVTELRWVDEGYLTRQRELVEDITTREYGARLRGNKSDLRSLERIINDGLINQTETQKQQALGVVLGDIFAKELKMEWRVYEDEYGKSRAVCIPKTTHCLFPVTMLSKRMRLGVKPSVTDMYNRGEELMQPHMPRLPYSSRK